MHLLIDISAHGLGHLAQTAPVIDALCICATGLELTIRSALPLEKLQGRIRADFNHVQEARDFGFVMHNAVDVDLAASANAYREFHRNWLPRVETEAQWLLAHKVDAVLTNVSYLPLAAASKLRLPAASLSSLNWADLFWHYFATESWAIAIYEEILFAYQGADCFLRLTPGLPMKNLSRRLEVGPIARIGKRDRALLMRKLGISENNHWILLAMGGMEFGVPIESWDPVAGLTWLVPDVSSVRRRDVHSFDHPDVPFSDVLASADAVITKPGYGIFVEAACAGIPILYLERDDWLETAPFCAWLAQHARSRELRRSQLLRGQFVDDLAQLWQEQPPKVPIPSGAEEAAKILLSELRLQ